MHTDVAVPTVGDTFFISPSNRGSFYEGVSQARPPWDIHKASVVLFAANRSSTSRRGAGEKKGGKVGASCRRMERTNGKIKGIFSEKRGSRGADKKKGDGVGVC